MLVHILPRDFLPIPVWFYSLDSNWQQDTTVRPEGNQVIEHMIFVLGGIGELKIDGKRFPLKRGSAFYFAPRTPHSYINIQNLRVAFITFQGSAVEELRAYYCQGKKYRVYENIDVDKYAKYIQEIQNEYLARKRESEMSALLYKIIMRFFEEGMPKQLSAMEKAALYIEQNFQNEIKLEELLNITNSSKSKFCKDFKTYFGCTAFEKISEYRLSYAKQLLENSGYDIKEVAYTSGFNDTSYFCSCYKKKYGKSPGKSRVHES